MTAATITSAAYIAVITGTTTKLAAPLPEPFTAALDQARHIREATNHIEGSGAAVNDRIITCLKNGTDWHTDKALQALMFERVAAANGIRTAGTDAAENIVRDAIIEHTDAIIDTWHQALTPDIAALTDAAQRLTLDTLDAADVPTLSAHGLVTVWANAQTAVGRFNIALDGWRMIVAAHGIDRSRDHEPLAITDTPNALTLNNGRDITVWTLARAGAHLDLATPAEYMHRVHTHEAAMAERQREAEQQRQRDQRRSAAI